MNSVYQVTFVFVYLYLFVVKSLPIISYQVYMWQELGVTKLGHVKRIQQAINELKKTNLANWRHHFSTYLLTYFTVYSRQCASYSALLCNRLLLSNPVPCHFWSTQPGHPSVGGLIEYRPMGGDVLRLGVKAGMARVRWQVKLCDPFVTRVISDRFRRVPHVKVR